MSGNLLILQIFLFPKLIVSGISPNLLISQTNYIGQSINFPNLLTSYVGQSIGPAMRKATSSITGKNHPEYKYKKSRPRGAKAQYIRDPELTLSQPSYLNLAGQIATRRGTPNPQLVFFQLRTPKGHKPASVLAKKSNI